MSDGEDVLREPMSMNVDQTEANENMDMPAHIKTYESFMSFAKFGIGVIVTVLVLMAIFLV